MASLAAIIVAAALLEDDDFLALRLRDNLSGNRYLGGVGQRLALACQKHITQSDCIASFASQLFNGDFVSGGNPILFAARAHNCEHGGILSIYLLCPRSKRGAHPFHPQILRASERSVRLSETIAQVNARSQPFFCRWRAAKAVLYRKA